jgi:RNA polymerase sigma-70 factor (ECF subfamily)
LIDKQDRQLVARAQAGERQALGDLLSRHQEAIFSMSLRILQNRDEALDATQEALLRVVRHLKGFRPDRPLRPWIRKIAVRAALDQAGRRARIPTGTSDPDLLPTGAEDPQQAVAGPRPRIGSWPLWPT